jgi:uncharacterized protein (DUF433 family)
MTQRRQRKVARRAPEISPRQAKGREDGRSGIPFVPHVTADADVPGGRAGIVGTEISVVSILELMENSESIDDVVNICPELSREAVQDPLRYAAGLAGDELAIVD